MKKIFLSIGKEITFLYTEIKKSFSSSDSSYFSSKRIERMILFITALVTSNVWFWTHYPDLDINEMSLYIGLHLGFAGYTMATTQKEKKFNQSNKKEKDGQTDNRTDT